MGELSERGVLLLIDDFQAIPLVLVQGHQDADTVMQIGHQLLVITSQGGTAKGGARGGLKIIMKTND